MDNLPKLDATACQFINKMVKEKEEKVRKLNGEARKKAFESILNIVSTLSKQVDMMMGLKKTKEAMLAEGKQLMVKVCSGAQGAPPKGGNRYKKRNRKTYKKQKRGGRGKSRRRRKQKSKHRRTKRR